MTDPLEDLVWNDAPLWSQFVGLLAKDGEALAIIDPADGRWSRADMAVAAEALAARLLGVGVAPGDRVLFRPDRTARTAIAALATSRLGAVLCLAPPDAAPDMIGMLSIRATIEADLAVASSDLAGADRDPRDEHCVVIATTSGSTGRPKFVMHRAAALNYSASACAAVAGLRPGEAIFAAIGPDSAAGFALSFHMALALGHPLVLACAWDPVGAMRRIVAHDCRWTTMVPTQLLGMVEVARDGRWTGTLPLRAVAVGGSAMTAALIDDAARLLGVAAVRMFGLSECLAHCSTRLGDADPHRLASDGLPFPGTSIEAFAADGGMLGRGERGQAGVNGPSLFLGYAQGHGAGEESFTPSGHLLTGDEIVREADGHVRVVGRIKDQIIRGGFNIDPAEVEAVIALHPSVAEVAVVAMPDARLGERACAVVRLRRAAPPLSLESIRATLADAGLYRRKWPEQVAIVEVMPRLPGGKIDRRAASALVRPA